MGLCLFRRQKSDCDHQGQWYSYLSKEGCPFSPSHPLNFMIVLSLQQYSCFLLYACRTWLLGLIFRVALPLHSIFWAIISIAGGVYSSRRLNLCFGTAVSLRASRSQGTAAILRSERDFLKLFMVSLNNLAGLGWVFCCELLRSFQAMNMLFLGSEFLSCSMPNSSLLPCSSLLRLCWVRIIKFLLVF